MTHPIELQALVRDINEALVLAVLRNGPAHGYQIALDVERRTAGMFAFQHGTLYPILHRLEKRRVLSGTWSEGDGRRRKEYRLTEFGRTHLSQEGERLAGIFATLGALFDPNAPRGGVVRRLS